MTWIRVPFVLLACFVLLAAGCGPSTPKGVIVTGKILKGGDPMPVERPEIGVGWVELHLMSDNPAAGEDRPMARAAADGSFKFLGPGRGVKPGKYKLAVYHREKGPPGDSLNGAFSGENTKITVDVPESKLGGALDLGTIDLNTPPEKLPM